MKYGRAIREIREEQGITLREFSRMTDTQVGNLSVIERDKHGIKLFTLECIATGLGVKVSDIILRAESYETNISINNNNA